MALHWKQCGNTYEAEADFAIVEIYGRDAGFVLTYLNQYVDDFPTLAEAKIAADRYDAAETQAAADEDAEMRAKFLR